MSFSSEFGKKFGERLGEGMGNGIIRLVSVLFEATVYTLSVFGKWWFDWQKGTEKESWFQANTLRIAVTSFILAFFVIPGFVTISTNPPQNSGRNTPPATSGIQSSQEDIPAFNRVYLQLSIGPTPTAPSSKDFTIMKEQNVIYYTMYDGIKYFRYTETPWYSKPITVDITGPSCSLVPAGKKIRFLSEIPPRFVFNMTNTVRSILDPRKIPKEDQSLLMRLGYNRIQATSWETLRERWQFVHTDGFVISASAEDPNEIPYPHLGGMVCF